ncbi:hypothetical protein, partial [Blautia wexlerae]|uniref:hypothetical protein n=1 Tax=Blautia wexlerae TaxID=418240 RepID=UPI0034A3B0B2
LFVFQSSVFRISEKLHNGKQGFALTRKTKNALHRTGHFCCKIMLYTDLLLPLQKQPDNL